MVIKSQQITDDLAFKETKPEQVQYEPKVNFKGIFEIGAWVADMDRSQAGEC